MNGVYKMEQIKLSHCDNTIISIVFKFNFDCSVGSTTFAYYTVESIIYEHGPIIIFTIFYSRWNWMYSRLVLVNNEMESDYENWLTFLGIVLEFTCLVENFEKRSKILSILRAGCTMLQVRVSSELTHLFQWDWMS